MEVDDVVSFWASNTTDYPITDDICEVSNKPKKHVREAYDYLECRDYLQDKYNYTERDFSNKYDQDFWQWVMREYNPTNGCYMTFTADKIPEIQEDWAKTIYRYYLLEFSENGKVTFWVWW